MRDGLLFDDRGGQIAVLVVGDEGLRRVVRDDADRRPRKASIVEGFTDEPVTPRIRRIEALEGETGVFGARRASRERESGEDQQSKVFRTHEKSPCLVLA